MMKKILALALVVAAFAPAVAAQTAGSFTGKWEGTFVRKADDGTDMPARPVAFDLTQKGNVLTGTAGPPNQQIKIEKAAIKAGKAAFEVPLPNGTLFKFNLSVVKGHLQGDMTGEKDGAVTGRAKVDATKAAKAK